MKTQLTKRTGSTETKFIIEVPTGKQIRIISVTFNWALGSGLLGNESATVSCSALGNPLWQVLLPLQSAAGLGTFAVGLPAFALYQLSFVPATGAITYLTNLYPSTGIPDVYLVVPNVTILWTNSNTATASGIIISYELDDL